MAQHTKAEERTLNVHAGGRNVQNLSAYVAEDVDGADGRVLRLGCGYRHLSTLDIVVVLHDAIVVRSVKLFDPGSDLLAIDLARDQHGQGLHDYPCLRHHVDRQLLLERGLHFRQLRGVHDRRVNELAVVRRVKRLVASVDSQDSNQPLLDQTGLWQEHDSVTDAVHLAKSRLDLAELHTLAVKLDLMILAAKALDCTVGVVSHQVTSLVDSVCGRGGEGFGPARVVNELGVCLLGVVQVLSGQSAAGKGQFANGSDGCQTVVVIGINDPGTGRLDAVSDASRLAAW